MTAKLYRAPITTLALKAQGEIRDSSATLCQIAKEVLPTVTATAMIVLRPLILKQAKLLI